MNHSPVTSTTVRGFFYFLIMENLTKVCKKCKIEKGFDLFQKYKKSRDGYRTQCKQCDYEYHKKYCQTHRSEMCQYVKKNGQKNNYKHQKEYHKNNPNNRIEMIKNGVDSLNDRYVKSTLKHSGFSREMLESNPEIVEVKRLLIKTRRLCKTSQI